jgi:hypothetical protein
LSLCEVRLPQQDGRAWDQTDLPLNLSPCCLLGDWGNLIFCTSVSPRNPDGNPHPITCSLPNAGLNLGVNCLVSFPKAYLHLLNLPMFLVKTNVKTAFKKYKPTKHVLCALFWQDLCLNSGLHACKAGTLPLEPCVQSGCMYSFFLISSLPLPSLLLGKCSLLSIDKEPLAVALSKGVTHHNVGGPASRERR